MIGSAKIARAVRLILPAKQGFIFKHSGKSMQKNKRFTFVKTQAVPEDHRVAEELLDLYHQSFIKKQVPHVNLSSASIKRPALLFAVFDLTLQTYLAFREKKSQAQEVRLNAAFLLLETLFYELRLAIENGEHKAETVWERFQTYWCESLRRPEYNDSILISNMMTVLQDSGLSLSEALLEELRDSFEPDDDELGMMDEADVLSMFDSLLDELTEMEIESPFIFVEMILGQLNMLPQEIQDFAFARMSEHRSPLLNELAFLFLLHPHRDIRVKLAQLLAQPECKANISPVTLRRLIGMRNWLPEAERSGIDAIIKKARNQGVACAPLPAPSAKIKYLSSLIDGVGASITCLISSVKRRKNMLSILSKQNFGLRDFIYYPNLSEKNSKDLLNTIQEDIGIFPVTRDLLNYVIPHYLAVGLAQGNPPPSGLLLFAEEAGSEYWLPHRYDAATVAAELLGDDSPAALEAALARSEYWLEEEHADSWFEGGEYFREQLEDILGKNWRRKHKQAPTFILEKILAPKRQVWSERLLFTGLWLKFHETGESPAWADYVRVAQALADTRIPIQAFPLMEEIARVSFEIAKNDDEDL
jgi:hypothetical protein